MPTPPPAEQAPAPRNSPRRIDAMYRRSRRAFAGRHGDAVNLDRHTDGPRVHRLSPTPGERWDVPSLLALTGAECRARAARLRERANNVVAGFLDDLALAWPGRKLEIAGLIASHMNGRAE